MDVKIRADVRAYLEGILKVEQAMKKQRRRERTWNIIGIVLATILVSYLLCTAWSLISGAAW